MAQQQEFHPGLSLAGAVDLESLKHQVKAEPGQAGGAPAAGGYVIDTTENTFQAMVQTSATFPILLLLWIPTDDRLFPMARTLGDAVNKLKGQIQLSRIDIVSYPSIAQAFQVQGAPALFALIVSVGAVAAVLYSRGYLAHYLGRKSPAHISLHYTALATMFYAMLGVVTSEGGFSFLFFWELMTVASFLLILFDAERREVRRAALAYVIMMHVGFALLLIGFVRLDSVCGSADFALLGEYFRTQPALPLFVVFLAGFGMKAGMFPMHVWLPEAHPAFRVVIVTARHQHTIKFSSFLLRSPDFEKPALHPPSAGSLFPHAALSSFFFSPLPLAAALPRCS